jgi:hypothetical protein
LCSVSGSQCEIIFGIKIYRLIQEPRCFTFTFLVLKFVSVFSTHIKDNFASLSHFLLSSGSVSAHTSRASGSVLQLTIKLMRTGGGIKIEVVTRQSKDICTKEIKLKKK